VLVKAKRLAVIGLILFGSIHTSIAQESTKQIIIGDSVSLNSDILNEKREIMIYRPKGYDQENKKYPVLYLLDAEYQFHYVTGVTAFLSEIGHIPEMIVVGITNTDRNRDLTPEPGEAQRKRFPTSGGADLFLKFLDQELIPHIESRYRVVAQNTVLDNQNRAECIAVLQEQRIMSDAKADQNIEICFFLIEDHGLCDRATHGFELPDVDLFVFLYPDGLLGRSAGLADHSDHLKFLGLQNLGQNCGLMM